MQKSHLITLSFSALMGRIGKIEKRGIVSIWGSKICVQTICGLAKLGEYMTNNWSIICCQRLHPRNERWGTGRKARGQAVTTWTPLLLNLLVPLTSPGKSCALAPLGTIIQDNGRVSDLTLNPLLLYVNELISCIYRSDSVEMQETPPTCLYLLWCICLRWRHLLLP